MWELSHSFFQLTLQAIKEAFEHGRRTKLPTMQISDCRISEESLQWERYEPQMWWRMLSVISTVAFTAYRFNTPALPCEIIWRARKHTHTHKTHTHTEVNTDFTGTHTQMNTDFTSRHMPSWVWHANCQGATRKWPFDGWELSRQQGTLKSTLT